MKTILMLAFALPLLSACASSPSDADEAANAEPKQYLTGSIIPTHARKASSDQDSQPLLPASYGSSMTPFPAGGKTR
jgi:hypothetical protein